MKYRVRIDLAFPQAARQYADQARDALLPLFQHAVVINEGQLNEERGIISVEKCYHDEEPTRPCEEIARWEAGRGRVI